MASGGARNLDYSFSYFKGHEDIPVAYISSGDIVAGFFEIQTIGADCTFPLGIYIEGQYVHGFITEMSDGNLNDYLVAVKDNTLSGMWNELDQVLFKAIYNF